MLKKYKSKLKDLLKFVALKWQSDHRKVAKKPSEVYLSITDDCCLRCKMCDIWKLKKKQEPLSLEKGKEIIDVLNNWLGSYHLTFAGGEPFLNRDFIKLIEYVKKNNDKVITSTNTNAFVLNKNLVKKIANSGLDKLFISLDGLEKEHNYIRGRDGSYKKIIKAIEYFKAEKSDLKIYINTVISANNYHQLKKIIKLTKHLSVDGINFQILMPNFATSYDPKWFETNKFWPKDKKKIKQAIKTLRDYKKKYGDFVLNSTLDFDNFENYLLDPKSYQENEACFVGLNNIMLNTTGDISLCYEMSPIGNILKGDPNKIWIGVKAQKIRKKISSCKRPCKLLPCNNIYIFNWLANLLKR